MKFFFQFCFSDHRFQQQIASFSGIKADLLFTDNDCFQKPLDRDESAEGKPHHHMKE